MLRFQVILSSMEYFPDNKTSNFVTKLSRTLQLDGEWEVGLAEIDYPHTWYNIREGKNSVEIYAPDNLYLVFKTAEFSIQPGYYHWKKRLISIICKYPGKIMEFSKFHLNSK